MERADPFAESRGGKRRVEPRQHPLRRRRLEARIALRPRSPTAQTDGRHTRRPVCMPPAHFENSQKGQRDARCNAHAAARHECAVWPPSAARPPRLTQSVLWIGDAAAALPNQQMPARPPARANPHTDGQLQHPVHPPLTHSPRGRKRIENATAMQCNARLELVVLSGGSDHGPLCMSIH